MKILIVCPTRTAIELAAELPKLYTDIQFDLFTGYISKRQLDECNKISNLSIIKDKYSIIANVWTYSHLITFGCTSHPAHKRSFTLSVVFEALKKPRFDIQHGLILEGYNFNTDSEDPNNHIFADHKISLAEYGCLWKNCDREENEIKHKVGIATNLHWAIYSDKERTLFRKSIWQMARKYPEYDFYWRQHPAEFLWPKGKPPEIQTFGIETNNIHYYRYADTEHQSVETFMNNMDFLIMSPSTLIIDAERTKTPGVLFDAKNVRENIEKMESVELFSSPDKLDELFSAYISGEKECQIKSGLSMEFNSKKFRELLLSSKNSKKPTISKEQQITKAAAILDSLESLYV